MDWLVLLLLLLALGIGWVLGRASYRKRVSVADLPTTAIRSLTEIINQEPDVAIDQFIREFQVTPKTFDTHMALDNASRRRGEIEKAIKLHQNLIPRPNLSRQQQDDACLELAKDYLQAGLLDRAESLFVEIIKSDSHNKRQAMQLLLVLYEDEHEWTSAIDTAKQLLGKRKLMQSSADDLRLYARMSQHYCELAEQHIDSTHFGQASSLLEQAAKACKSNQRVSYLKAVVAIHAQDQMALKSLLPSLLDERSHVLYASLWMVPASLKGRPKAEAVQFFVDLYCRTHSLEVLGLMSEHLGARNKYLNDLLEKHIDESPSLEALAIVSRLKADANSTDAAWQPVNRVLSSLTLNVKRHRCQACGFSSKQLFWRCPSCKAWDSMTSISGENFVK